MPSYEKGIQRVTTCTKATVNITGEEGQYPSYDYESTSTEVVDGEGLGIDEKLERARR